MKVPFVDLYSIHKPLEKVFISEFKRIIRTNSFVAGKETELFEQDFASYCGAKHALLVNNGTSALFVALSALHLPRGGEVIIPVNTFIATAEAAVLCGLKPIFVDINKETFLMDLEDTAKKISKKTVAIIPVHLYGQRVNIMEIKKILKKKKSSSAIVEDACQAHGAIVGGKSKVEGDVACYSFYPGKNLGALGEAGAVVTDNTILDQYMRLYRGHGSRIKYFHDIVGMNLRASEMQAVFLRKKLPLLSYQNKARLKAVQWYAKGLRGIKEVKFQVPKLDGSHVYHLFVVHVKNRDELIQYLHDRGIDTGIHYPVPLHKTVAFEKLYGKNNQFFSAELTVSEILSLPMFATITQSQVEYVCKNIRIFYKK
ncbi:MAG: DegT/DnrJ/EryC1/StrS family aminotransferase [Candidatus Pacebacteria bacterium]|nr:DegT/DnrJ/EryC1/StrS family aminotransferase [Candidatus Paceibacterota bacterium]